jgi:hypothetical protein
MPYPNPNFTIDEFKEIMLDLQKIDNFQYTQEERDELDKDCMEIYGETFFKEMIYKGKWIEKADDSYLEDCYENKLLTIHKKYNVSIFSINGVKNASVICDDDISISVDPILFWTLEEWRDIKLKTLGIK